MQPRRHHARHPDQWEQIKIWVRMRQYETSWMDSAEDCFSAYHVNCCAFVKRSTPGNSSSKHQISSLHRSNGCTCYCQPLSSFLVTRMNLLPSLLPPKAPKLSGRHNICSRKLACSRVSAPRLFGKRKGTRGSIRWGQTTKMHETHALTSTA